MEALAREEEIVCKERISLRINVSGREFSSNHAYSILIIRPVVGRTMLNEKLNSSQHLLPTSSNIIEHTVVFNEANNVG